MRQRAPGLAFSTRLYRLLLRAYPRPFQNDWATEMCRVFRDRYAEEYAALGLAGIALLWLAAAADVMLTAPKEHLIMLAYDLRFAARTLRRSPSFSVVAILCLALGIGASTGIFSLVHAVVLKPLPFRDSGRLVQVYSEFPEFPGGGLPRFAVSPPEFREIGEQPGPWDRLEAWNSGSASLQGTAEPVRITACALSGGLMPMLGVAPARGRVVTQADDVAGTPMTIVLSDGLWRRAFGADPGVIGRTTRIDGTPATIVGVMPASFAFPAGASEPAEAWVPLQLTPQQYARRGSHFLSLLAHLRPGVTIAMARAQAARIVARFGEKASPKYHVLSPRHHPLVLYSYQDEVVRGVRKAMWMLLGAVGFFLLIACVNVANLLLARSNARQREIAIRKAIGAAGPHLIRQFAVEGLLLSGAGAALGLLLAWGGVRLVATSNAGTIPRIREAGLHTPVLLFALGVCVVTGLVFGMAPVLQMVARPLGEALKSAAGRTSGSLQSNRFRAALVVVELSLAMVLLIGSGLLVKAFWQLQQVPPGMNPQGLLTARLSLSSKAYEDPARLRGFWQRLNQSLAAVPGVNDATLAAGLPPQRFAIQNDTEIEHFVQRPGGPTQNVAFYQVVGARFFETLGVRLVEGRFFDARDGFGTAPVVIVNETMARSFWPGESAIGKRLKPYGDDWLTVVGVIRDVKNAGLDKLVGTEIFLPAFQFKHAETDFFAILKTRGDPRRYANALRQAVQEIDPAVPVSEVRTMEDVLAETQSRPRFLAMVLSIFSTLALALAAFGVYGVISYSVSQRTPEFGIRMALGAQRRDLFGLVFREGSRLGGIGLALGCGGAMLLSDGLEGLLFRVSRFDGVTFGSMALVLAAVTLLACWVPARRATTVDPIRVLRYE